MIVFVTSFRFRHWNRSVASWLPVRQPYYVKVASKAHSCLGYAAISPAIQEEFGVVHRPAVPIYEINVFHEFCRNPSTERPRLYSSDLMGDIGDCFKQVERTDCSAKKY